MDPAEVTDASTHGYYLLWNQRTSYKGGATYCICNDLFNYIPFQNGGFESIGRLVGRFRSYGRLARSTVHRTIYFMV